MKTKFKSNIAIIFVAIIIILEIGFVLGDSQGVYVLEKNSEGVLRPVLKPFSNGEVNIDKGQTVYLDKGANEKDGVNSIGLVENVKIKKGENGGVIVEFKDKGLLMVTSEDLKQYTYDGLNSQSKFYFDKSGKITKLDVETSKQKTFNLGNYIYDVPTGTQLKFENGKVTVNLKKGGEFSYYPKDKPGEIKKISNIKEGGNFLINDKGEIESAQFTVTGDMSINHKGYNYKVTKDSEVKIDGKNIDVTVPDGTSVESPEKETGAEEDVVFSFHTKSGGALSLSNGDFFESKDGNTVLYSKGEGLYFKDKDAVIKSGDVEDFSISNAEGKEVYLVFNQEDIAKLGDKASIFIGNIDGKNNVILSSLSGKGPAISFAETNRYGIKVTSENTAAAQAIDGRVFIEQGDAGKVASIKISGNSISTLDKRSFYGENGQYYFDPAKQIDANFNYGKYSTAARVVLADNDGNRLGNINFDVYANDMDQYASVVDGKFQSSLEFFKTAGNFYVSSTVAFNQLTPDQQEFFDKEINPQGKEQLAATITISDGKVDASELQRVVERIRIQEEERRKNPPLASVRIPSGGGSGTIIGVDQNGRPVVLTAGHLGGATSPGSRERVQMADGRQFYATVIGGYSDYGGSGWDVAIMVGDQVIDKVPYVPVAPESHIVNRGDLAVRIGCPGCGDFKITNTRVGSVGNIIGHGTSEGIIGGESGGGLFHNGRLIGVVSTGGYYSGTPRIREFLAKQGYSYLIKYILIFLDI